MPTTTTTRRMRRSLTPVQKILLEEMGRKYLQNQKAALLSCWTEYGRENFEHAFRHYLVNHTAVDALKLAVMFCESNSKER